MRTLWFELRLLRNEPRERDLNASLNLAIAVSKSSAPLTRFAPALRYASFAKQQQTTVTACGLDNADVARVKQE